MIRLKTKYLAWGSKSLSQQTVALLLLATLTTSVSLAEPDSLTPRLDYSLPSHSTLYDNTTKTNESIERLQNQGLFPEDENLANKTIQRRELVDIFYHAFKHNEHPISQFPFYRDIKRNDADYNAIETLRERKIISTKTLPTPQGFFSPDKTVTIAELYRMMNAAVPGKQPSESVAKAILAPYHDLDELAPEDYPVVAKLVSIGLLKPNYLNNDPSLEINFLNATKPLTYGHFALILERELDRKKDLRLIHPKEEPVAPYLPSGLVLQVVPSNALYKNELIVGNTAYFTLTESATALPKGASLRADVIAISDNTVTLSFNQLSTQQGMVYQIAGELSLDFPNKDDAFIVPGEPYTFTTQLALDSDGQVVDMSTIQTLPESTTPMPTMPISPEAQPLPDPVLPNTTKTPIETP